MFDAPYGRVHTLASRRDDRGVFCGPEGLFIGPVPLLDCEIIGADKRSFTPRPLAVLNRDLERCYGMPIDAAAMTGGIGAVARALNDSDPARACIAAVFLRLPEVPDFSQQSLIKCATALVEIGLLKADPSDPKHPGYPAGTEGGKGGRFRPKTDAERTGQLVSAEEFARGILTSAAAHVLKITIKHIATGAFGSILGPEVPAEQLLETIVEAAGVAIDVAREIAPFVEAYLDAPRTLDELREAAKTRRKGYDNHHVVEQATAAQDGSEDDFIESPNNLVSIPTAKHWDLNSWYETKDKEYGELAPRQYLKGKSLATRYRVGLEGLRKIGVLKP